MSSLVVSWSVLSGDSDFGVGLPFDSGRMPVAEVLPAPDGLSWLRADGQIESLCAGGDFQRLQRAIESDDGLLVVQLNAEGVCVDATVVQASAGEQQERVPCQR